MAGGTFDKGITRADTGALIPEAAVREIFKGAQETSVVGRLARRLPDMARGQLRLPILQALTEVYFVGEAGRGGQTFDEVKQTTEAAWGNKYINAEEMAAIIPIPKTVLEDADYDIWAELRPDISTAIGAKIDSAVFAGEAGVSVPASWPDGLLLGMPHAHQVALGEVGDLYDDIFGVGGVVSKMEDDGYIASGYVGAMAMRARLRGIRQKIWNGTTLVSQGEPLFVQDMRSSTPYTLDGMPVQFPTNGSVDASSLLLMAGQWDQLVWSVRRDVTFDLFTEGVITDNATPRVIIHNLMQDDMVALRVTFRMGWQLPNPVNRMNSNEKTRYPFAALIPTSV